MAVGFENLSLPCTPADSKVNADKPILNNVLHFIPLANKKGSTETLRTLTTSLKTENKKLSVFIPNADYYFQHCLYATEIYHFYKYS